ncbi:MAG TPA: DUF1349 domain-containing protein, partial [Luteolibacter sp.]
YTGASAISLSSTSASNSGSATLNLNGGTFITGQKFNNAGSVTASGTANLNFSNGGILKLSADVAALATTAGRPFNVQVGSGGGVIDTNGFSTDLAMNVSGNGDLAKRGGGVLTLSGSNIHDGATTIEAGTLAITGALGNSTVSVANGATLAGSGSIAGTVDVQAGGKLAPAGTLTINNTLALSGSVQMKLSKNGATLGNDRVAGISTVNYGGTLVVTHQGDALTAGNSFQLFAAAHYSGNFSGTALPSLASNLLWDTSTLPVDGTIRVIGGVPTGWTSGDIGLVGVAGSASESGGTYTVSGSGTDIWGTADSFQFVSQTLTGDGEIRARVTSQSNPGYDPKAGVMIRSGSGAGAVNAMMTVAPAGYHFQYRATASGTSGVTYGPAPNPMPNNWIRLVRSGNLFTGYRSADGVTWTQAGSVPLTMGSSVSIGLAVCSKNNSGLSTATFDNVSITPFPLPWQTADIGATGLQGSAEYFGSAYTVKGAGTLDNTSDKFRFVYQTISGDGEMTARIKTPGNTGTGVRVGVMIRDSLATNSMYAFMGADGANNFYWQRRSSTGGNDSTSVEGSGTAPNLWVRVVRTGNTLRGYKSADGASWTLVNSRNITMGANIYVGMVGASGSTTTLNTSVIDNVTVAP